MTLKSLADRVVIKRLEAEECGLYDPYGEKERETWIAS